MDEKEKANRDLKRAELLFNLAFPLLPPIAIALMGYIYFAFFYQPLIQ